MEEFLLYTPADRNYGLLKYCEINHVNLGQLWKRGLSLVPSRSLFFKVRIEPSSWVFNDPTPDDEVHKCP